MQLERRRGDCDDAGVGLFCVGIGTRDAAEAVATHVGYDPRYLLADPENALYDVLGLNAGVGRTFFNPATPYAILDRLTSGTARDLGDVLGKWLPSTGSQGAVIIPPKQRQAFNQGGMFVFDGVQSKFVHYDAATGAHADVDATIDLAMSL